MRLRVASFSQVVWRRFTLKKRGTRFVYGDVEVTFGKFEDEFFILRDGQEFPLEKPYDLIKVVDPKLWKQLAEEAEKSWKQETPEDQTVVLAGALSGSVSNVLEFKSERSLESSLNLLRRIKLFVVQQFSSK